MGSAKNYTYIMMDVVSVIQKTVIRLSVWIFTTLHVNVPEAEVAEVVAAVAQHVHHLVPLQLITKMQLIVMAMREYARSELITRLLNVIHTRNLVIHVQYVKTGTV